jgi:hypothetical protein
LYTSIGSLASGAAGRNPYDEATPSEAEVLAFESSYEDYCEREVDEGESQGGQVYLPHLGARLETAGMLQVVARPPTGVGRRPRGQLPDAGGHLARHAPPHDWLQAVPPPSFDPPVGAKASA